MNVIVGEKSRSKESRYFDLFTLPLRRKFETAKTRDYNRLTRNNKRNTLLSAKLKMIVYKKKDNYLPIL